MDCRFLETALEQACDPGLVFQVLSQETYLYVYVNRDGDIAIDFDDLTERVRGAIVAERLKDIRWLCIYSRPFGMDDPDWDLMLELQPPTFILDPLPPRSQSRSASSIAARTLRQTDTTVLLHDDTGIFEHANMEAPAPSLDDVDLNWSSPSDGGSSLPSTLGLDVTEAPPSKGASIQDVPTFLQLPEEEDADLADLPIVTVPAVDRPMVDRDPNEAEPKAAEPKAAEPKAVEPNEAEPKAAEPKATEPKAAEPKETDAKRQLSDYCFVRNSMLLTSKIQPPSGHLSQLLMAFHGLGESAQMELLAHFSDWFRQKGFPQDLPWSPEQRAWIEDSTLEDSDPRRASIWFSRYCRDPAETVQAIEQLQRPKAEADEPPAPDDQAESPAQEESQPPQRANQKRVESSRPAPAIGGFAESLVEKVEPYQPKFPDWVPLVALGVATCLAVISSFMVSASFAGAGEALCKLNRASKYCNLAVEMIGVQNLEKAQKMVEPITSFERDNAIDSCLNRVGAAADGRPWSVSTKDVLKNLIMVDFQVKRTSKTTYKNTETTKIYGSGGQVTGWETKGEVDYKDNGPKIIRVACLGGQMREEFQVIQTARIPTDWPKTAYDSKQGMGGTLKLAQIQSNPIFIFSTAFVFTTAGLLLAVVLNLGIQMFSLEAVAIMAIALASIETVLLAMLPFLGGFLMVMLDMLILIALSFKVNGVRIDMTGGYRPVFMGVAIMIFVRQILTWTLAHSAMLLT
jgi:hypothetical protein